MSKLQERLQTIGSEQLANLARMFARLHFDLLRLRKFAAAWFAKFSQQVRQSVAQGVDTLRARLELPRIAGAQDAVVANALAEGIDDRRSVDAPRPTRVPDDHCVYAIGDIHGRCDLLEKLLDEIDADAQSLPDGTQVTIVFLGDYIDRGMQSRQVIELLLGDRLEGRDTVFLMGNHEEALLRFREDAAFGRDWARFGGAETLYSYGLQPPSGVAASRADAWTDVWQQFRAVFPEDHLDFYQSMAHYHTIGDYLFVHAGLRPGVDLDDQSVEDMLWIRDEFLNDPKAFEYKVVHGHTPARVPYIDDRRIGLDTSAYSTGVLTAARFLGTEIEILKTS